MIPAALLVAEAYRDVAMGMMPELLKLLLLVVFGEELVVDEEPVPQISVHLTRFQDEQSTCQ